PNRSSGLDQRTSLAIQLNKSGLLLCLFQCLFCVRQFVLGVLELAFEKQASLSGFTYRKVLRKAAELLDISVSQFRGALRILIFYRQMNEAIFAISIDARVSFEDPTGIGRVVFAILVHQPIALDHRIFDGPALEHSDVHVVGTLQSKRASA